MSSEWKNTSFEESIEINPPYSLKRGWQSKKIAMSNLTPFLRRPNYEIARFKGGSKFKNGDTLVARITPCLENGKTCYVDILSHDEVGFGSTEFIVLRGKPGITDNKYVYYLATWPEFRSMAIKSMTGTSGRQRVQIDALAKWHFRIPKISEQKEIATLLSNLDDKIELNHAINKNLETMAQALFKRWFVDFEFPNENGRPYKSSGGAIEESALGLIPKGWHVGTVGEVVKVVGGSTPSTAKSEFWGGAIHWVTPKDLSRLNSPILMITERKITESGLAQISSGLLPKDTLLMSSRAPIGYLAISKVPIAINQGFIAMVCHSEISNVFMFFWTKQNMEDIKGRANGTTFGEISKTNFRPIPILIPKSEILKAFNYLTEPFFDKITNNDQESQTLALLRDTLLPKLMSGEIRVPVEQVYEEVHTGL